METTIYQKNKPFVHSLFAGLFYFAFCWSIDLGDAFTALFTALMLFLPGLTFPLTTCYFKKGNVGYSDWQYISHLALSVGIYHAGVWLFSGEGKVPYITLLAGFLGSLFFLVVTKLLLKKEITWIQIAYTSALSGLAFLPYQLIGRLPVLMGLAVFSWTLVNGQLLNYEYRKHLK